MNTRRNFIKSSFLGAGALAMSPYLKALPATNNSSFPKRFVFVRFSNGLHPKRLPMQNLPANLVQKEKNKEAYQVALDKYELPEYLTHMNDYKENMCILQGMSLSLIHI